MTEALIALCLAGILAGCAPTTQIVTNKETGYTGQRLTKLFIFSYTAGDFNVAFDTTFNDAVVGIAGSCGVEAEVATTKPGSSDHQESLTKMAAFQPDAVLVIERTTGQALVDRFSHNQTLIERNYNLQLLDVRSHKLVWRADAAFRRGPAWYSVTDRANALAAELMDRMKADGLLPFCPASSN